MILDELDVALSAGSYVNATAAILVRAEADYGDIQVNGGAAFNWIKTQQFLFLN